MQKTHDTEPFQELVKHIANRYWKEVFLLTAEALANADNLLNVMKVKVNQIVAGDEKIQQFLVWVNEKSFSVSTSYKPAAVRDFYFSGCPLFLNEAIDPRGKASHTDGLDCVDMIENMDDDLDLCIDANLSYALEMSEIYASQSDPSFSFDLAINSAMQLTDDTDLYYELYDLYDQFPDDSWDDPGALHRWWQINGQAWSKQLQTVMIEYRNLGHTWQFLSEQKHLLQRYRIVLVIVRIVELSYSRKSSKCCCYRSLKLKDVKR